MKAKHNYFCPDCGWEGEETICAICGSPTESLAVDPTTGKVVEEETLADDLGDEFDDDFVEDDDDLSSQNKQNVHKGEEDY